MSLIEDFYAVVFKGTERRTTKYYSDIPPEMIVRTLPDNQIEWRLIPWSETVVPEFEIIEQWLGYKLPVTYKLWFNRYYRLGSDSWNYLDVVSLTTAPLKQPFVPLLWQLELVKEGGLINIGIDHRTDLICLDASQPTQNGDYAVVRWFHDHGMDTIRGGIRGTLFSSFEKLLECVTYYHSSNETNQNQKRKRVLDFSQIDPEGAGSKGRSYWETFAYG